MNERQSQHEMPSDPQLDAFLDEVLKPAEPAADLAARIVAATSPQLRQRSEAEDVSVLARISPSQWRVAAAVAFAVLAGAWAVWVTQPTESVTPSSNGTLAAVSSELSALAAADQPDPAMIDQQIEALAMQVELTQAGEFWSQDSVEDAALDLQLQRMMSESVFVF